MKPHDLMYLIGAGIALVSGAASFIGYYLKAKSEMESAARREIAAAEATNAAKAAKESADEAKRASDQVATKLKEALAAMPGNFKDRQEAIELRSKLLQAQRAGRPEDIEKIVDRISELAREVSKREQDERALAESRAAEFTLRWTPLVDFTASEFDKWVAVLNQRKLPVKVSRGAYDIVTFDMTKSFYGQTVRQVAYKGVQITLLVSPAEMTAQHVGSCGVKIEVTDLKNHSWKNHIFGMFQNKEGGPGIPGGNRSPTPVPEDGIIPVELTKRATTAINDAFEQFLVFAEINGQK